MNKTTILFYRRDLKEHRIAYSIDHKSLETLVYDLSFLCKEERSYFNLLKHDQRKKSYLLGRYTAKKALSILLNEVDLSTFHIDFGVFNYPVVNYPAKKSYQVSITHSEKIVISLAHLETHPITIDLELIDSKKQDALLSQVSKEELHLFEGFNLTEIDRLTMCWTIKEALSKMLRTGLMTDFNLYNINLLEKDNDIYISTFANFPQYKSITKCIPPFVCSVVIPKNSNINFTQMFDDLQASIGDVMESEKSSEIKISK